MTPKTLRTWPLAALLLTAPVAAGAQQDARGFLYGTVETDSGNRYTGLLRWGREEAFWDDHFNATKPDEPATGRLPEGYHPSSRKVEVFGLEVSGPWDRAWATRQFVARFGDIAEIEPGRGDRAEVRMKSGTVYRLDGGSNDMGATIHVVDASLGQVDVEWRRIRSIRFAPAPGGLRPAEQRLHAKVRTSVGDFEGYLQWDKEEALTGDKLDGETDDGKVSIEMGKIRAISRRGRRAVTLELVDGRRLEVSGSNDVDSSNRGICVEDARFGRVEIPWDVFERAELSVAPDSGRGYEEYPPGRPLSARVTARDGRTASGRIAFDLDETESWELLDGAQDDVAYAIPFDRIATISPLGRQRSEVVLASGVKLRLEGPTDVSEDNAGIAFLGPERPEGAPAYLPWDEVAKIEIER